MKKEVQEDDAQLVSAWVLLVDRGVVGERGKLLVGMRSSLVVQAIDSLQHGDYSSTTHNAGRSVVDTPARRYAFADSITMSLHLHGVYLMLFQQTFANAQPSH